MGEWGRFEREGGRGGGVGTQQFEFSFDYFL